MRKLIALIAAAVATSATLPAFAETWTDPSTGIEWTYTVTNNEAVIGRLYKKAAIPVTTSGDRHSVRAKSLWTQTSRPA